MKNFHFIALLFLAGVGFTNPAAAGTAPAGKGTLTITGSVGAGQNNVFTLRKCQSNTYAQYFNQDRTGCEILPFTAHVNEPVLLDAGVYSVSGPQSSTTGSQILGVTLGDGQDLQLPLREVPVTLSADVRYRVFLDLSHPDEFYKMQVAVWSSRNNAPFLNMACSRNDAFSQFICDAWKSPLALNEGMVQTDAEANYFFIHPDALREAGTGFRMSKLGRIYVNDLAATGTSVYVFPGIYGIEFLYPNSTVQSQYKIVVN